MAKKKQATRSRTYPVDGEKVRALRIAKGWTVEQLAIEADISPATIAGKERGELAYMATLRALSSALGTTPAKLIKGHKIPPEEPLQDAVTGTIHVTWQFDKVDEAKIIALLEKVSELIGGELRPLKIRRGSIFIDVAAERASFFQLIELFLLGQLPDDVNELRCDYDVALVKKLIERQPSFAGLPPAILENRKKSAFAFFDGRGVHRFVSGEEGDRVEVTMGKFDGDTQLVFHMFKLPPNKSRPDPDREH